MSTATSGLTPSAGTLGLTRQDEASEFHKETNQFHLFAGSNGGANGGHVCIELTLSKSKRFSSDPGRKVCHFSKPG